MLQLFLICFLATMTPGPDVLIVSKNSLEYGFKIGLATSFGIASSLSIHLIYTNMGFLFLVQKNPILFKIISVLGFLYLSSIGLICIFEKKESSVQNNIDGNNGKSVLKGFKNGFLTNILNVNVPFFFLFIFTEIIGKHSSSRLLFLYSAEIVLTALLCFFLVSAFLSISYSRKLYFQFIFYLNKIFGIVIIFFAFKILL